MIAIWFFFPEKEAYSDSVLGRLKNELKNRPDDGILYLKDNPNHGLFSWYGKDVCIYEGHSPAGSKPGHCLCKEGWAGKRCGLPEDLLLTKWLSDPLLVAGMQASNRPRRIVYVISDFFYDSKVLEINLKFLGNLLDVVIISEDENIYKYKNESLLSMFHQRFLQEYHNKFVYINISHISSSSHVDKMQYTLDRGLQLLSDVRIDDILLIGTPNDIFDRKFLVFLKVFHNYPVPIHCDQRKLLYGPHWKSPGVVGHSLANEKQEIIYKKVNSISHQNKSSVVTKSNEKITSEEDSKTFSNLKLLELYGHNLKSSAVTSNWPVTCALSIHLFNLVFEGKFSRMSQEKLLYKDPHLSLFDNAKMPVFPWIFPNTGWSCHFCHSNKYILRKLEHYPYTKTPDWVINNNDKTNLDFINHLRITGQDENLEQALPNSLLSGNSSLIDLLNFEVDSATFIDVLKRGVV